MKFSTDNNLSSQAVLQLAEAQCRQRGSRLTAKRKVVLQGLLDNPKALSAYELVDYFKNTLRVSIPAMSVYRILDFLQQQQLVHKLSSTNKFIACSHIACDHRHDMPQFLICKQCGDVKEIALGNTLFDHLQDQVQNAGYQLRSTQLELDCICHQCAEA